MLRRFLIASLAVQCLCAAAQAPHQDLFPGYTASPVKDEFPGITPLPIGKTPLSHMPPVLALDHLEPAQMSDADNEVVSNLSAELSKQAALANFDISQPA